MIENNDSMTLLLTGDLMITKDFLHFQSSNKLDIEYPFTNVKEITNSADIVFSNLECTLSKDGLPMRPNTGPLLYSPPDEIMTVRITRYLARVADREPRTTRNTGISNSR